MTKQEEIREGLAKNLYEQHLKASTWVSWEELSNNETRETVFAFTDTILSYLKSKGVVIKVDRELPAPSVKTVELFGYTLGVKDMLDAKFLAVEELI